jgi:hypothetical protein
MIPSIAVIDVAKPYWRGIHLWLPLFLLWIPGILIAPLILLVLLVVCLGLQISFGSALAVLWGIACSLPGTNVHVRADGTQVHVRIL